MKKSHKDAVLRNWDNVTLTAEQRCSINGAVFSLLNIKEDELPPTELYTALEKKLSQEGGAKQSLYCQMLRQMTGTEWAPDDKQLFSFLTASNRNRCAAALIAFDNYQVLLDIAAELNKSPNSVIINVGQA